MQPLRDFRELTHRRPPITHKEVVLSARVVGGIQMIDDGEADDKIVAVLHNDPYFDTKDDLSKVPKALVDRPPSGCRCRESTTGLTPGG